MDVTEQQFRVLIESLTDYAVFMIDPSGEISSWNPGVQTVLGYSADEFIHLPFAALFTPEDIERAQPDEELARALATGRSRDTREHVGKGDRRFRAEAVLTALRDEAGAVL